MPVKPFKIILSEQALVVTFDRPCQVVSWAPLHGGFLADLSVTKDQDPLGKLGRPRAHEVLATLPTLDD